MPISSFVYCDYRQQLLLGVMGETLCATFASKPARCGKGVVVIL